MICIVCHDEIVEGQVFFYHARLNVYVHTYCDITDVCGEDISTHTLMWGTA